MAHWPVLQDRASKQWGICLSGDFEPVLLEALRVLWLKLFNSFRAKKDDWDPSHHGKEA